MKEDKKQGVRLTYHELKEATLRAVPERSKDKELLSIMIVDLGERAATGRSCECDSGLHGADGGRSECPLIEPNTAYHDVDRLHCI